MHVLGKVLLGLVFLLAGGATLLTTMLLDVRSRWQQQVTTAKTDYENSLADLEAKKNEVHQLQRELERAKFGWGNVWMADNNRVIDPRIGTVSIGIGTARGLGIREQNQEQLPLVHAFSADAGRDPEYLGAFQVQQLQAGAANAVRLPAPAPDFNMPSGTWRIREEIPYNFSTRFMDLHQQQLAAAGRLMRMQQKVQQFESQKAASQALLQERVNELEGDASLANATELQKSGLIKGLNQSLAQRDQKLQQLQALRLDRLQKLKALEELNKANREKVNRYEQKIGGNQPAPATADVSTASSN